MKSKRIMLGLLLGWLLAMADAASIAFVPQTGQTSALPLDPAPTGSDGNLQKGKVWPVPRFVGDASANCITDKLTGLMWVRDLNTVNSGSTLDWNTALTMAANGNWCGYNDWRVPNINELRSLVNFGVASSATWLNTLIADGGGGFSNIQLQSFYWSSTSSASDATLAWVANVDTGIFGSGALKVNASNYHLLPVRGGQ